MVYGCSWRTVLDVVEGLSLINIIVSFLFLFLLCPLLLLAINKKKRSPTTIATALLTATFSVTAVTEHNTDHMNHVSALASKLTPIQDKQPTLNSYYPCTDGIFAYNPAMNFHYHAIRHNNQN